MLGGETRADRSVVPAGAGAQRPPAVKEGAPSSRSLCLSVDFTLSLVVTWPQGFQMSQPDTTAPEDRG